MTQVTEVGQCTIVQGDNLETLRLMPDCSVQCCVTSPPYWGLRDYGKEGQLGLEKTPDEYVAKMVAVFREVKRVLRDDGTLWLNLGDSYARSGKKGGSGFGGKNQMYLGDNYERAHSDVPPGLKQKDLVGIPWRVAFALQADGWYLRQDIIWHKPNPMPESVRDRCTKAHEYIFMLTKSAKYYYDNDAIAEPMVTGDTRRPYGSAGANALDPRGVNGAQGQGKQRKGYSKPYTGQSTKDYAAGGAQDASATKARIVDRILSGEITGRNKRSVWTVTTKPFKGAHFATFPPDLIEPCILAGSKPSDVVLDPFGGAGTTGLVAQRHNRKSILLELNPDYVSLTAARLQKDLEK